MTTASRAQALFVSDLQPSGHPTREQVAAAVTTGWRRHGGLRGCEAACAAEYGAHPDTAASRMRWALATVPRRDAGQDAGSRQCLS